VVDPYWIRYDNRTFLNKGAGPMRQMLANLADNVKTGDTNWVFWFGTNKTAWPFNSQCCATQTYYRQAKCGPPTHSGLIANPTRRLQ